MDTQQLSLDGGTIAYDDTGGDGPLLVMLPGAGDVRDEYRFLAPALAAKGARVVTADLRGHGESSTGWPTYGMVETAADLVALLDHLEADSATVVATSFAPTAALWAAAEHPALIGRLVLVSAHLEAAPIWQRIPLSLMLHGPLAGKLWASQFRKWHPGAPPADLEKQATRLSQMLSDRKRRRAARETLVAHRDGLDKRIEQVNTPTLVVMGGADSHFKDPTAEGESIATQTRGALHVVRTAGHYPHVEFPDDVAGAVWDFLAAEPT